jgi:hypothetical protein
MSAMHVCTHAEMCAFYATPLVFVCLPACLPVYLPACFDTAAAQNKGMTVCVSYLSVSVYLPVFVFTTP